MSELVYVGERPKAILGWVTFDGMPIPLYTAELDPAKLRKMRGPTNTYRYEGTTVDPRYADSESPQPDPSGDK